MSIRHGPRRVTRFLCAAAAVGASAVLLAPGAGRAEPFSDYRDELYIEEAARIAPYADQVERYGEYLTLRAVNGERVVLVSAPDGCDNSYCISYLFDSYMESLNSFLIEISYYESYEYLLVDRRDATQTTVAEQPHPDPEGRRFIATLTDDLNGHVVQMWRMTLKGPLLEFSYDPPAPYCFVAWRTPDDVELVQEPCTGDSDGPPGAEFHLLRNENAWRLVGSGVEVLIPAAAQETPE